MTDYIGTRPDPVTSDAQDDKVDPRKPDYVVHVHYFPPNPRGDLTVDTFLTDRPDGYYATDNYVSWDETYLKSNGAAYYREVSSRVYNMRHVVKVVSKRSDDIDVKWRD